jgi:RsmE family RNA methyltransferase
MNIVLLKEKDFISADRARLSGRASTHIRNVLKVAVGDVLKIGRLNGELGQGAVRHLDSDIVELDCVFGQKPPRRSMVTLLMALPRPQTLKKVLLEASSLGLARFIFVRAHRTDNSYLQTKVLRDKNYLDYIHLGLEQSGDTLEPALSVHRHFRRLLESELEPLIPSGSMKILADPEGATAIHKIRPKQGSVVLAIGPEGGWIAPERSLFQSCGFESVSLGQRILRVETATVGLLSQLSVLREISP